MKLKDFQELVESKLRESSRVPRTVRLLVAECIHIAYTMGKEGDDNVVIPQTLSDDAMIEAFLKDNQVTEVGVVELDPTQTTQSRRD